eukprot:scaffold183801_cov17-Tisochrysis_lutea.AAC.1
MAERASLAPEEQTEGGQTEGGEQEAQTEQRGVAAESPGGPSSRGGPAAAGEARAVRWRGGAGRRRGHAPLPAAVCRLPLLHCLHRLRQVPRG